MVFCKLLEDMFCKVILGYFCMGWWFNSVNAGFGEVIICLGVEVLHCGDGRGGGGQPRFGK